MSAMRWKRIKTAPDWHTILLWPDNYGNVFAGHWNEGSGSWSRIGDYEYNPQNPTHWMLMPDPPVENKIQDKT